MLTCTGCEQWPPNNYHFHYTAFYPLLDFYWLQIFASILFQILYHSHKFLYFEFKARKYNYWTISFNLLWHSFPAADTSYQH